VVLSAFSGFDGMAYLDVGSSVVGLIEQPADARADISHLDERVRLAEIAVTHPDHLEGGQGLFPRLVNDSCGP